MFNVVGLSEYAGLANSDYNCWLCQKPVSSRALFCHHCGTIQPVRDIDHFARLGLDRKIDIDLEQLESQYAALCRTLDPQRFLIRGLGERGYALKQLEALTKAYETLADPLKRGRYWLEVHKKNPPSLAQSDNKILLAFRQELASAADASQFDRVAQRVGYALEVGIMGFMQALRGQDWAMACAALVELDGLEVILGDVRLQRANITEQPRTGPIESI